MMIETQYFWENNPKWQPNHQPAHLNVSDTSIVFFLVKTPHFCCLKIAIFADGFAPVFQAAQPETHHRPGPGKLPQVSFRLTLS